VIQAVAVVESPAARDDGATTVSAALRFGRQALWNAGGLLGTSLANVVVLALAVRTLGPSDYGLFALSLTATALLGMVDGGLSTAVVRSVAIEAGAATASIRTSARRDVACAHSAYAGMAAAALLLAAPMALAMPHVLGVPPQRSGAIMATTLLLGAAMALQLSTAAAQGIATGRRDFRATGLANLCGAAATVALAAVTVHSLGVVGLGIAQLGGVVCARLPLLAVARRAAPWWRLRPGVPARREVRMLAAFVVPLLLITAGTQLVDLTDALVVSAVGSTFAVGLYRVGTALPTAASGLLFRAADTTFPMLAGHADRRAQERAFTLLTTLTGYAAGIGFGVLLLEHDAAVALLQGRGAALSSTVLMIFCAIWLSNAIQHGVGLLLVARARQRRFVALVCGELVANMALTVVLGLRFGPAGAAWATLVTMLVSNLVLLPLVVRREMAVNVLRVLWVNGGGAACAGVAVALLGWLAALPVTTSWARLAVAGVTAFSAGGVAAAALARARGWLAR